MGTTPILFSFAPANEIILITDDLQDPQFYHIHTYRLHTSITLDTQNKHMYMSVTKLETKNHGNLFQMNSEVIMINHNLYMKHNLQHKMDRTFTYTCKFVVVHVHSNYKSISVHKKTNDILVHLS